jgi:hypothetical protein
LERGLREYSEYLREVKGSLAYIESILNHWLLEHFSIDTDFYFYLKNCYIFIPTERNKNENKILKANLV